jgi:hypothetical protein
MKSVKIYPAIILALLLSSAACEKESTPPDISRTEPDPIPIDSRLTCTWRQGSVVDSVFTDYISEVKQIGDGRFILHADGMKKVYTGYLGACNFPEEAKKDGLHMKVSGYLIIYPGITEEDIFANPFEITSYQILK